MKRRALILGHFSSIRSNTYRGVCEDLAEQLASKGWEISWASGFQSRPLRLIDMLWTILSKRRHYDVAQVDVYSGLAFRLAEVTCLALRLVGKRYVITLHGGNLPQFSQKFPGRVQSLLNSAEKVTAPSAYLLDALKSFRSDILLLPNPLPLSNYRYRLRENPAPRLLWLRNFHHVYNPSLAIKALDRLLADFPEISLAMVGPDKNDGSLEQVKQAIHSLGLESYVQIVPGIAKSEVPAWLDRYDIFVNTTNIDNTPVSVMEAMASGMCIVSTNVGGIPALITDGEQGLLVPPNDPEALASAIRQILSDVTLAKKLSSQARQRAEGFDWSVLIGQWETLLVEAVDESCSNNPGEQS